MKSRTNSAFFNFSAAPFSLFLAESRSFLVIPPPLSVFQLRRGVDDFLGSSFFLAANNLSACFSTSCDAFATELFATLSLPPDAFAAARALAAATLRSLVLSAYDFLTSALPRSFSGCCSRVLLCLCVPISLRSLYDAAGTILPPPTAFILRRSGSLFLLSAPTRPPSPVLLICERSMTSLS